jgi:hypothetical protein
VRGSTTGLIASATVAALGLVGCASGHGTPAAGGAASGSGIMLAAYTHTVGQKTAKMSLTETVSTSGGAAASAGGSGSPAASGSADSSATIIANGSVDFTGQAADLTMQVQGQQLEIREIGSTIYLHLPASLAKQVPGGKAWISVDLNKISQAKFGASLSSLTQTSQANPAQMLSYLQAVSQSGVHKAGTATLRGVQTTQYDATVDLNKLAAKQTTPAAQQAMTKLAAQLGTSGYPMKIWIGQDGFVHQMQFSINEDPTAATTPAPGSAPPAGAAARPTAIALTATIQLYDYGTPVTVTAPPAGQTTDLTNTVTNQVANSSAPAPSGPTD